MVSIDVFVGGDVFGRDWKCLWEFCGCCKKGGNVCNFWICFECGVGEYVVYGGEIVVEK